MCQSSIYCLLATNTIFNICSMMNRIPLSISPLKQASGVEGSGMTGQDRGRGSRVVYSDGRLYAGLAGALPQTK